jgi:hypothetical protein
VIGWNKNVAQQPGYNSAGRQDELAAGVYGKPCLSKLNQRAERPPGAASDSSALGGALTPVCFSAPESPLELRSVSRLALRLLLELESEAPL